MRIGIDLGGTKIEIAAIEDGGAIVLRERTQTPQGEYEGTVRAIAELVSGADKQFGARASVGVAIPGTISTQTGLVKNANSACLIGHPLDKDIEAAIGRPVRVANDANCFALSEAIDGAAKGAEIVFGAILGTGVGAGLCVGGQVLTGAHGIAGEWGHNPLPSPAHGEVPGPECYCGRRGCIEAWCSGPALARQFHAATGRESSPDEIAAAAEAGDALAAAAMDLYLDRLARAFASIVNVIDPDVIVLGGGLSNIGALTRELPGRIERYAFSPEGPTQVVRNLHGDSSGVRGAAWLWPVETGNGP